MQHTKLKYGCNVAVVWLWCGRRVAVVWLWCGCGVAADVTRGHSADCALVSTNHFLSHSNTVNLYCKTEQFLIEYQK